MRGVEANGVGGPWPPTPWRLLVVVNRISYGLVPTCSLTVWLLPPRIEDPSPLAVLKYPPLTEE
jgi:hypothetical protein